MFIELSDREVELLINATRDKLMEAVDGGYAAADMENKREWDRLAEEYRVIQEKLMG